MASEQDEARDLVARAICEEGTRRPFSDGDTLCEFGEVSDRAFVIESGRVEALVGDVVVATRHAGSILGEITALFGGARTATLRADGPVEAFEVSSDQLRSILDGLGENVERSLLAAARDRTDRARVATILQRHFDADDPSAVTEIAQRVTWRLAPAGANLFSIDDPADGAYLLLGGRMQVLDREGRLIRDVLRGHLVGEFGLLETRPRTATVHAVRDCFLARLSIEDFQQITVRHPSVAAAVVRRVLDQARPDGIDRHRGRVVAVVDLDRRRPVVAELAAALSTLSSTTALTSAEVDALLGEPGMAQSKIGGVGEVRLTELLHEIEQEHDQVFLDLGDDIEASWARRCLRSADLVVALVPPAPTSAKCGAVQRLRRLAPAAPVWVAVVHPEAGARPSGSVELRDRLGVERLLHLRGRSEAELGRLARLAAGRGIGLVLSGGGGRGHAHLGVLEAIEELGIPVDTIVGASMGSVIAGVHAQGLTGSQRRETVADQTKGLLDYTVPVVSMLSGRRISRQIVERFGEWDILDTWLPFACVSTSLTRSDSRTHREGPMDRAIRASVAIPGVLPPVPEGDELLIDGGVLDNLPVGLLLDDPAIGTVIASDVAPPRGPSAKEDYGMSVSGVRVLGKRLRGKAREYPGIVSTLLRATLISSTRDRDRFVESGAIDCYLDLDLRGVGLLDFEAVDSTAVRGKELAMPRLEAWWATSSANPTQP